MTKHVSMRLDWDEVDGKAVTSVLGLGAAVMNDGSAVWDAVAICFKNAAVLLTVERDTDQVTVVFGEQPTSFGWASIPSFDFVVGGKIGWCWVSINSQGYKDGFTIALSGIGSDALDPRCTFIAAGSRLSCFDLIPRALDVRYWAEAATARTKAAALTATPARETIS